MAEMNNILGFVGICRKAGKTVTGTDMICELLRKRGISDKNDIMVLEASDTSDNTHKRLTDKCIYYKVKHIKISATCEILGKAVGKNATAAVAITDVGLCAALEKKLTEN